MDKMKVTAPLDPAFTPIYRGLQAFAARAEKGPEIRIAVERNGRIVPKAEYGRVMLAKEDEIEIVSFVGGG